MQNGILPLNDQILQQLKQKHPETMPAAQEVLLPDIPESIHSIKFANVDADMIRKAAIKTRGGAGPSRYGCGWMETPISVE